MSAPDLSTQVEQALRSCSGNVARLLSNEWQIITAHPELRLQARLLDGDWLEFTAVSPPLPFSYEPLWSVLRVNARLTGCTRLVRQRDETIGYCADVFLGFEHIRPHSSLESRINTVYADLLDTCHRAFNSEESEVQAPAGDAASLIPLCADAGWHAVLGGSGEVRVPLQTNALACDALLEVNQSHVRAVAPLTTTPVSTSSCEAIGWLLLGVSLTVRGVKGIVFSYRGAEVVGLATDSEQLPLSAPDLGRILASLHVACGIAGREVLVLQEDGLARAYLELQRTSERRARTLACLT